MSIASVTAGETATAAQYNTVKNHLEGQAGSTLAWFLRAASGENVVIRLSDNAAAKKFSIQDSDGVEIASVDSNGAMTISGTMTPTGLTLPTGTAPTPTTDGEIWWDTDDDILVVGTGSTQKQIGASTSLKTSSGGYFTLPTTPSLGTTVASSASANTYGTWVEFDASTSAAIYVVGFTVDIGTSTTGYVAVDVGTGSTTSVGEWTVNIDAAEREQVIYPFPIPVATTTRIAVRTADQDASARSHIVSLICINQADLVAI